ncbi:wall-associated receptor kinase 3-like isoform X2 [Humulus lupulus]|uniref:wall-associated receptor kinase 3-like isoform X2 n=1 Tax=Humulus lupulus TaxID=3486 RepID=UPI002B417E13|nr:wall-associated receptor kinase 3-like isoform X2 [Humulus lupulus]
MHLLSMLILSAVYLMIWSTSSSLSAPDGAHQVLPHCRHSCGNLTIPYPFGIGEGCYMEPKFNITCQDHGHDSATPPIAFLGTGNINVTKISLFPAELQVLQYTARDCYDSRGNEMNNETVGPTVGFEIENFEVSATKNKFTAIGCDMSAIIVGFRGKTRYTTGCMSVCDRFEDIDFGKCAGNGCCQITNIPIGLNNFSIKVESYFNHTKVLDFNPCSYAFLAEETQFKFTNTSFKDFKSITDFPLVLDWAISNMSCDEARMKFGARNMACKANSKCVNPSSTRGYLCRCLPGYDGNPYRPKGCQGVSTSLIALLLGSSILYWGMKKRKMIKLREKFFEKNGGFILQQQLTSRGGSCEMTKIFTSEDLRKATNNFHESRIIGEGGYGIVYKGILPDQRTVAIKKSKVGTQLQSTSFINEVTVLMQLNHRNVVKLLGCCLETKVPLLVYEFINNGTLSQHIHIQGKEVGNSSLSWEVRLSIATETAEALAYLHSEITTPIIHRDVKSANILLDDHYMAKVSDFGASRLVPLDADQVSTFVQGTFGYLDPEYMHSSQLTEKSDVYSFGVVLAELLTSRKAVAFDAVEMDYRNLAMCFVSAMKEDRLLQILDSNIVDEENIEVVKEVANITKRCLRVKGDERPSMKEVAMELERLKKVGMCSEENEDAPAGTANLNPYSTETESESCGSPST